MKDQSTTEQGKGGWKEEILSHVLPLASFQELVLDILESLYITNGKVQSRLNVGYGVLQTNSGLQWVCGQCYLMWGSAVLLVGR